MMCRVTGEGVPFSLWRTYASSRALKRAFRSRIMLKAQSDKLPGQDRFGPAFFPFGQMASQAG